MRAMRWMVGVAVCGVTFAVTMPMAQSSLLSNQALARISSFDQKPAKGGTPEMASQPTRNVAHVIGIHLASAPMRFIAEDTVEE